MLVIKSVQMYYNINLIVIWLNKNNFPDVIYVVNNGDYVQAVCDRNLAENISRVLYPNDNVSFINCTCSVVLPLTMVLRSAMVLLSSVVARQLNVLGGCVSVITILIVVLRR